jgi:hypothetical protein
MPEKFIQLLKAKNIFNECELKDHPDTCCNTLNTKVINFDEIKKTFFTTLSLNACPCGSVDVLYLSKDKSKLFLIEMKSKNTSRNIKDWVSDYFKSDEVPKQIIESIILILGISGYYRIEKDFYNYIFDNSKRLKAIFLSNFTDRELATLTMASMHKRNLKNTKMISGKIGIYNNQSIQDFFTNN